MVVDDVLDLECTVCLAAGRVHSTAQAYRCAACGTMYEALSCFRCNRPYLNTGYSSKSRCPGCGFEEKRKACSVATFGEIADQLTAPSLRPKPAQEITSCYVVDGAGWAPDLESIVTLVVAEGSLAFWWDWDDEPTEVPFDALQRIDVQGYQQTKGGGFLGGGFGAKGALEGMAAATILNALTTRSSHWVIVTILGDGGWTVLRIDNGDEKTVRRQLRPAQDAIATLPALSSGDPSDEFVAQLERLVALHERGMLDASEFQQAKAKLLDQQSE